MSNAIILTPAYSHAHHGLHEAVRRSGMPWMVLYEQSDVVRVRSVLLSKALDTEAQTFVLVDADVVPGDGMLAAVAAAATPSRAAFGLYTLREGKRLSVEPLDTDAAKLALDEGRPFPILWGGLGLCAIDRRSLERVAKDLPLVTGDSLEWRPFCLPFVSYGNYHGDDRSLCTRLRASGTELWCDPRLSAGHAVTRIITALRA